MIKQISTRIKDHIEHRESQQNIGTHIIADLWEVDHPDDIDWLTAVLVNAAHVSNAKILDMSSHKFDPEGATIVLLLAESHISIHTWPEYGYVAVDIFTCGQSMQPKTAIKYLESQLKPNKTQIKQIHRGHQKYVTKRK